MLYEKEKTMQTNITREPMKQRNRREPSVPRFHTLTEEQLHREARRLGVANWADMDNDALIRVLREAWV